MTEAKKREAKAREQAKRHGLIIRRIPHSQEHPNGYIKITDPEIMAEYEARDFWDVQGVMYQAIRKRQEILAEVEKMLQDPKVKMHRDRLIRMAKAAIK